MPKTPKEKKSVQLRHEPIGDVLETDQSSRLKGRKNDGGRDKSHTTKQTGSRKYSAENDQDGDDLIDADFEDTEIPEKMSMKILHQAKLQRAELVEERNATRVDVFQASIPKSNSKSKSNKKVDSSDDESDFENEVSFSSNCTP